MPPQPAVRSGWLILASFLTAFPVVAALFIDAIGAGHDLCGMLMVLSIWSGGIALHMAAIFGSIAAVVSAP